MIMAVVGYALVRLHALKQEDSRVLLQPCLILRAFQIELTPDRMQGFIFATVASTISMLISIAFAKAMEKPLGFDPVDRASLTYANVGNLILPLISMSLGEEMVFYGSAFQIPFNLLIWTHCYSMLTGGQGLKLKKMVTNPSLIALCVGLFLLITQIRLPSVVDDAARGFHEMVAASSMMLIGMIIADSDLKSVFTYKKAYIVSFFRLMAPCAATIVQMVVVGGKDAMKASVYNVMSTILCVVTIPLMILLFQILFPQ